MLKSFFTLLIISTTVIADAGSWADIFYYEKDFPRRGNEEYLNERCKLDLYVPENVKDFPTVIFIHGGGLTGGEKNQPGFDLSKMAVASINYRISGSRAECPDYIYDAAAATAWVLKNIAQYGGDPKKVCIAGVSAGGYLAAMLALAPEYLNCYGVQPEAIANYYLVSGQMTTHYTVVNEQQRKDPSVPNMLIDKYSPLLRVRPSAPPITFIVGDPNCDWPARVEENMFMAAHLKRVHNNSNVRFYSYSQVDHAGITAPAVKFINNDILSIKPVK